MKLKLILVIAIAVCLQACSDKNKDVTSVMSPPAKPGGQEEKSTPEKDKPPKGNNQNGDYVGNGGSVVWNGKEYRLADLYFKPHTGKSVTFDGPLREHLKLIEQKLLAHLGLFDFTDELLDHPGWLVNPPARNFFSDHVFNSSVEFYFMEPPHDCHHEVVALPGFEGEPFSCTIKSVTYINPEIFSELSLEDKAATIIHERLHAHTEDSHHIIMPFIQSLMLVQEYYKNHGNKISVDLAQLNLGRKKGITLKLLGGTHWLDAYRRQRNFEEYSKTFDFVENGGGTIVNSSKNLRSKVSSDSYVSLGSFIGFENEVHAGAEVWESYLDVCIIDKDQKVKNSALADTRVTGGATIVNSTINRSSISYYSDYPSEHRKPGSTPHTIIDGKGTKIIDSFLTCSAHQSENCIVSAGEFHNANVEFMDAENGDIGPDAKVVDSKFLLVDFNLEGQIIASEFRGNQDNGVRRNQPVALSLARNAKIEKSNIVQRGYFDAPKKRISIPEDSTISSSKLNIYATGDKFDFKLIENSELSTNLLLNRGSKELKVLNSTISFQVSYPTKNMWPFYNWEPIGIVFDVPSGIVQNCTINETVSPNKLVKGKMALLVIGDKCSTTQVVL